MARFAGKRLLVIPSCPFAAYEAKGTADWLERYYNPAGAFPEVHAFTPFESGERHGYGVAIHGAPKSSLERIIQELRPDVVRAYGGFWPAQLALTKTPANIPVVVSVHDTRPHFARPFVRFADLVLCVSTAVKQRALKCNTPERRIRLLPNRVDREVFSPRGSDETAAIARRFSAGKNILFVGRNSEQKNIDTLIRAMRHLSTEYRAVFVGPGDPGPYRRLAAECGLGDRCHWVGAVANDDLPNWYSWCDCFCAPSRWEGFGLVFAEAAACGAAIVTTNIAPMNEILTHDISAYLVDDYENSRAIACAIHEVCENEPFRQRISTGALAAARRYDRHEIDELEVGFYEEAMAAGSSRGKVSPFSSPRVESNLLSKSIPRQTGESVMKDSITPTISVVLPTFNGHRFLREAVESCVNQTFADWELIIVDDCSTDETPRLIDQLAAGDERIRSIRHGENRKLPAALNTGFAATTGAFLTWTSDDNLYRPTAFERMLQGLNALEDADFVYAGMTIINDNGESLRWRPAEPPIRLALKNPIGACFLYRRRVQDTIGSYGEKWFLTEDYDYWLRVSGQFKLHPLPEDLYLYRDHGRSLTNSHAQRIEKLVADCFEENFDNVQWMGKRLLSERCLRFACEAMQRGDTDASRKWLKRARRTSPLSMLRSLGRVGRLTIEHTFGTKAG